MAGVSALALVSSAAIAQTTDESEARTKNVLIETITVTAQKREQDVQDVGIAVTAFSGDVMEQFGWNSSAEIVAQIPNVDIVQPGGIITTVNIRGVTNNTFEDHLEGPVALYIDQAYVAPPAAGLFQLFDLERVEVLRGPQGTLFGRNATGGLAHFISRKPTEDLEGYVDVEYSRTDSIGANALRGEAAISGPLSDNIQGRLSAVASTDEGNYFNRFSGKKVNGGDQVAIRGQLAIQAGDDVDILLKGHYGKQDSNSGTPYKHDTSIPDADSLGVYLDDSVDYYGTCAGCDAIGFRDDDPNVHSVAINDAGFRDVETSGVTATVDWDLGGIVLTSVTDYLHFTKSYFEDSDSTPFDGFSFLINSQVDQFSQELRLSQQTDTFSWVAGAYYLTIDGEFSQFVRLGDALFGPGGAINLDNNWTTDTDSWSVFGQVEYPVADTLTIVAGLRYTSDKRKHDFTSVLAEDPSLLFQFNEASVGDLAKIDDDFISWKGALEWRPNEDVLLFASVSRGQKGGSFNAPVDAAFGTVTNAEMPFSNEELTAYELGLKGQLADNRVRLNASVFYYDYKDYQTFDLQALTTIVTNNDAETYGAEAELIVVPTDQLSLGLGIGYLDATVNDFTLPSGRVTDVQSVKSPDWNLNGFIQYNIPVHNWGELSLQADANYVGARYFNISNAEVTHDGSYIVTNLRMAMALADAPVVISASVKNLTNEKYLDYTFDTTAFTGLTQLQYARQREFFLNVRYEF